MTKLPDYDRGRADERRRVLDCINELAIRLNDGVNRKIMTPAQEQLVNVRMQIAEKVFSDLRKAVQLGLEPTPRKEASPIRTITPRVDGEEIREELPPLFGPDEDGDADGG